MEITTLCVKSLKEAKAAIVPEGFQKVNVMSWHQRDTPYYELSPYHLRTDGNEELQNPGNVIFENFWQSAKVYPIVSAQQVYPHHSLAGNPKHLFGQSPNSTTSGQCPDLLWSWPRQERHIIDDIVQPEYYAWRDSLNSCQNAIRYPNRFHGRTTVAFTLLNDKRLCYLDARKQIYIKEYSRLVRAKKIYQQLLKMSKICIIEVDLPCHSKKGIWNTPVSNICTLTPKILNDLENSTENAFGHGLVLAKCLFEDAT